VRRDTKDTQRQVAEWNAAERFWSWALTLTIAAVNMALALLILNGGC
jgi:hypothetical protein